MYDFVEFLLQIFFQKSKRKKSMIWYNSYHQTFGTKISILDKSVKTLETKFEKKLTSNFFVSPIIFGRQKSLGHGFGQPQFESHSGRNNEYLQDDEGLYDNPRFSPALHDLYKSTGSSRPPCAILQIIGPTNNKVYCEVIVVRSM